MCSQNVISLDCVTASVVPSSWHGGYCVCGLDDDVCYSTANSYVFDVFVSDNTDFNFNMISNVMGSHKTGVI